MPFTMLQDPTSTAAIATRKKTGMLLDYGFALNDPPQWQAAESLVENGWNAKLLHLSGENVFQSAAPDGVECNDYQGPAFPPQSWRTLYRLMHWAGFRRCVREHIERWKPDIVITHMLHAFAAIPAGYKGKRVCFIPDIPSPPDCGRLGRRICQMAWRRLHTADIVWASDEYKAELAQKFGALHQRPIVCYNCPKTNYLPEPTWPRDGWLRERLRERGATTGPTNGCVLLRAGAVGECGGLEETLEAMLELPSDFVFAICGRPPKLYKEKLLERIAALGLQKRAFLWDKPSDEEWKRALLGADIGHLIHGPFSAGPLMRLFSLNSSLSNNRLYQYISAGLPIISYDDPRMNTFYEKVDAFRVARMSMLRETIRDTWLELGSQPAVRRRLGINARQAHLSQLHWEKQFRPVLQALLR